jgi:hypothetical protein
MIQVVKVDVSSNCDSEGITYTFLDKVFTRFCALIEVFINQGTKFHGEFQTL